MLAAIEISGPVSFVAALLGVAGLLGVIGAYMRTNLAKTTIELQKEEIATLQQRLTTIERDLREAKTRIAEQELSARALADLASGKLTEELHTAINNLGRLQQEEVIHIKECRDEHAEMLRILRRRKRNG